jgi:CubicO group peptidase (beta-lactamase class C family)
MYAVAALFLLAAVYLGYHEGPALVELLAVGSGFTATAVCYGHFVSRRELPTLQANELAGIPTYLTSFAIDDKNEFVVAYPKIFFTKQIADFFGTTSSAYYLGPDLGCRLTNASVAAKARQSMARSLAVERPLPRVLSGQIQSLLGYEVSAAAATTNQTRAVVVLHHGKVVGEAYQTHLGISADTPLLGWSMTKSVQSLVLGAMIQQGLLNLSTPAKYVTASTHRCSKGSAVTIGDLLSMCDVLPFEENYGIRSIVPKMLFAAHDAGLFAMNAQSTRDVAHRAKELYQCEAQEDFDGDAHDWYYSSGVSNLLAREIRSYFATDEEYWNFPRKHLFDPLGISAFALGTDPSGSFIASSFSYGTALAWAKLGQLLLQQGQWGDGLQLLPEEFVAWIQRPHPFSGGHYGGSFWLNPSRVDVKTYNYLPHDHPAKQNHYWMTTTLPSDAYFMSGFEGQYTIIIPSLDAVIVRLGFTSEEKNKQWDKPALFGGIVAALVTEDLVST